MAEKTATTSSVGASGGEKPEQQRTEELVQQGGPHDPKDYEIPDYDTDDDDEIWFRTVVRTSDDAQQMYLDGRIDEKQLAKAIGRYGRPINVSEVINRADAAYEKKLPKWVFSPPEGLGLTMEQRLKEAEANTPEPGPLTHEQLVRLPPVEQKKAAEEREKELAKKEKASSTPDKSN